MVSSREDRRRSPRRKRLGHRGAMTKIRWIACASMLVAVSGAAALAGAELEAGRDFTAVSPVQPTGVPDKIVVMEFFSYACPHCYAFSASVSAWAVKLPADVVFERTAVALGRDVWKKPAQVFYTARAMGKLEQLDAAMFRAIHVDQTPLLSDADYASWAAKLGVDRDQFAATFNSFSVKSFQARGDALAKAVRLPSVPTLVIDGKYLLPITDGSFPSQLAVADRLIDKARADKRHP
jgi:thiol:disulfide interchange protein DsbA